MMKSNTGARDKQKEMKMEGQSLEVEQLGVRELIEVAAPGQHRHQF